MGKILGSANKIVFILVAVFTCIGFVIGLINSDQFIGLVSMVFAFYYRTRPEDNQNKHVDSTPNPTI